MFIPAVGCPPATPSGQPTAGIRAARSQLLSGLAQSKSTKHRFKTKRSQPFLGNDKIKPHRIRYYLEKKDEQFEAKAKEVLLLYKKIEWITQLAKKYDDPDEEITLVNQEVFISYDEKPGIQAVE